MGKVTKKYKGKKLSPSKKKSVDKQKSFINSNKNEFILLTLFGIIFLTVGGTGLGEFFTSDETNWYYKWVQQYWDAYLSGNFEKTNFADYPGALHSFLCGAVNIFLDKKEYMTYDKVETYLFWWRFPILLFNCLSLIAIYYLLKKFFSQIQSFVTVFLIALSPFLLGMSRIVNSDSLLWSTSLISILAYIIFVRENKNKYMLISGIFMGMALASKYNAILLFVYHPIILIFEFLFDKIGKQKFKNIFTKTLLIWIVALAVFSIFLPAVFIEPKLYNTKIFSHFIKNPIFILSIVFIVTDTYLLKNRILIFVKEKINIKKYLIKIIPTLFILLIIFALIINYFDLKPDVWRVPVEQWKVPYGRAMYENLISFFASQQIVVVAGFLLFSIISLLRTKKKLDFTLPLQMLVFIFLFIIGTTLKHSNAAGHRYIIMLYPFALIIAVWTFSFFKKKYIIFALIILLSIIDTATLFPKFYITYRNSGYFTEIKSYSWSLGGYDLAQELNKLPNAERLKVYADRYSFKHFFKGYTENITNNTKGSKLKEFDYLCLSKAGNSQVPMSPPLEDYYEMPKDSFKYLVGDKNKWWMGLVKVDKNKKEPTRLNSFDPEFYLSQTNTFTIAIWEKHLIDNPGNIMYIGENYNTGIIYKIENGRFKARYGETEIFKSDTLPLNKLNNIAVQHINKDTMQIFKAWINGEKVISETVRNIKTLKTKFFAAIDFKGLTNDVRIYNRELSDEQIKVIYNGGEMTNEQELTYKGEKFNPAQHFTRKPKNESEK